MISHCHDSLILIAFLLELFAKIDALIVIVDDSVELSVINDRVVESATILVHLAEFIFAHFAGAESGSIRLVRVEDCLGTAGSEAAMDLAVDFDG